MGCPGCRVFAFCLGVVLGLGHTEAAAADTVPRFAYVPNAFDSSVSVFSVDAHTGSLRHSSHIPTAKFPTAVAADAQRTLVYVTTKVIDDISIYRADPVTGKLTWQKESSLLAGRSPSDIALHPLQRLLYVVARGGSVLGFLCDAQSGLLRPVPGSPFPAGPRARALVIHPNGEFLYTADSYSNNLSAYRINVASGTLIPIPGMPFATGDAGLLNPALLPLIDAPPESGGAPYYVAIDPAGKFLYAANHYGGTISAFAINTGNGALTPLPGNPFKTGLMPHGVTVHPSGHFLYVPSYASDAIWVHRIHDDNGTLTQAAGSPFPTDGEDPYAIKFDPTGTLAYVPNHRTNSIAIFRVNAQDGSLRLQERVQTRSGPQKISFASGERPLTIVSRYAYAVDTAAHQLVAYRVDADTGALKETSRAATGKNPVAAATSSDGKFVYVANLASHNVSAYRMDAGTGTLSEVAQSPFPAGKAPVSVAVDANGWFVYVTNQDAGTLSVFAIDAATGALKAIPGAPLPTGARPMSVVLDSAARYAYVANAAANTISLFRYWSSDSPLVDDLKRAGAPFATGKTPVALTVDPAGNHLYVLNQDAATISGYDVHFQSGLLRPIAGSPFSTGGTPRGIAIHPNGATVYVVNQKSRDISTYLRDVLTGVLKEITPRIAAGDKPISIVVDAAGRHAYVLNENVAQLRKYAITADGQLTSSGTEVIKAGTRALVLDRRIE